MVNDTLSCHPKGTKATLGKAMGDSNSTAMAFFSDKIRVDEKDLKEVKRGSLSRM